jgi:hypothetical protein
MEHLRISETDAGLHIEGFPDAVKVIRVEGWKAKQLADLALHKWDLEFAAECLNNINRVPKEPRVVSQALWRAAVVHFMKCFGRSHARYQLDARKIFRGNASALAAFAYFEDLRDKHFVHDENSYCQAIPGAILNNGTKPYKIEKVVCLDLVAETLEQDNYSNLYLLIKTTLLWITDKFDAICSALTAELEAESYEDLLAREAIDYKLPTIDEVGKRRKVA